MKLKELRTQKGQQELLNSLILWLVAQNKFDCALDLLESSAAKNFIVEYIEDKIHQIDKLDIAEKLQQGLISNYKRLLSNEINMRFNKALYDKEQDTIKFVKDLPELNTTDKNQPDSINKLMCSQFSSIDKTDVFLFACAGRGSDALYVCKTYGISKNNCYFIEKNSRLCKRLKSLGFKNVICGDILSENTWKLLYNILEKNNMEINKVLMNPPYDGSLHLEILEAVLKKFNKDDCEIVSIQPCDWLENPLTAYKEGEYKKFFNSTLLSLANLQAIDTMTAQKAFNIGTDVDLGIYTYKTNKDKFNLNSIRSNIANCVFNKIMQKLDVMKSLNDVLDLNAIDGWRVKLNELRPQSGGTNPNANGYSHKTWGIQLISSTEAGIKECIFKDGFNDEGIYWTNVRSKNQFGKTDNATFRHSIKTVDKQTAINIAESCNTEFYRNWIYLIKFNQHMPLRFLPYMEDYSKVWTNEDYCKFFDLTEEESDFMCRKVDDYRIKDFINYIKLDEE